MIVKAIEEQELDADVLIIGGGPAGSTLACLLALGNHKAIVIERSAHPREHVGEMLTPSINAVLHRIGLLRRIDEAGFMRRNGVGWTTRGAPVLEIPVADYPPPRALRRYGFNVEREAFDALLIDRARELGVQVLEHTTARRILFQNGRAVGIEILQPGGTVGRLRGRFIVDASGRRSLLGMQLGLVQRDSDLRQCALYAWFRDVEPSQNRSDDYAYLHRLGHRRKWAWQIPLRDKVTSIGVVVPCDHLRAATGDHDAYFSCSINNNRIFQLAMARAQRISPWRVVGDTAIDCNGCTAAAG